MNWNNLIWVDSMATTQNTLISMQRFHFETSNIRIYYHKLNNYSKTTPKWNHEISVIKKQCSPYSISWWHKVVLLHINFLQILLKSDQTFIAKGHIEGIDKYEKKKKIFWDRTVHLKMIMWPLLILNGENYKMSTIATNFLKVFISFRLDDPIRYNYIISDDIYVERWWKFFLSLFVIDIFVALKMGW